MMTISDPVATILSSSASLATAAALLGAGVVVAVDNDPESLASARHHAHLNGVAVLLVRGNAASALRPGQFDLILANLTAPLLRTHAGEIIRLLAPCGVLALSGLLTEEVAAVAAAYVALGSPSEQRDGEWSALRFTAP